jgi:hypothetical protein
MNGDKVFRDQDLPVIYERCEQALFPDPCDPCSISCLFIFDHLPRFL